MRGHIGFALFAVLHCVLLMGLSSAHAADGTGRVATRPVPHKGQPVAARAEPDGTIHLLYNLPEGPWYARSTDGGVSYSLTLPVVVGRELLDVDARLVFEGCDLAIGRGGSVHIAVMSPNAWKLKAPEDQWGLYYAKLTHHATEFSNLRQLNRTPSEGFSLAADGKGNVSACWLAGKLYANHSSDDGETFSPNAEIDPAFDPCDCCTTHSVYGTDGRLAVLYREETRNQRDMFLLLWDQQRHESLRTPISRTLWSIDTCPMTYFAITRTTEGFAAVWPTRNRIYFARMDSEGNLRSPGEIETPGTAGHRTGMLALSAADGFTLVAWENEGRLGWQLYDRDGIAAGPPGWASTSGTGVAGIVDASGQFTLFP